MSQKVENQDKANAGDSQAQQQADKSVSRAKLTSDSQQGQSEAMRQEASSQSGKKKKTP